MRFCLAAIATSVLFAAPSFAQWTGKTPGVPRLSNGKVNLAALYAPNTNVVAYGYAEIDAPVARAATLLVGSDDSIVIWLNGKKVVEYELKSADWKSRVAASKFASYPNYGLAPAGLIGIQGDHPGSLAIRAIRIREWR